MTIAGNVIILTIHIHIQTQLYGQRSGVSFPVGARDASLLQTVQNWLSVLLNGYSAVHDSGPVEVFAQLADGPKGCL